MFFILVYILIYSWAVLCAWCILYFQFGWRFTNRTTRMRCYKWTGYATIDLTIQHMRFFAISLYTPLALRFTFAQYTKTCYCFKTKKKNPKIMHIWVKSIEQTIAACWVRKKMCAQVLLGLLHTKQTALQMGFKNEKQQQLHSGHTYPQYIHILPCQDTINRYL